MAIELYHTLKSDKGQHRTWHDSNTRCRGSWTTFMAGLRHIEQKYLPSVELDHPILWAAREAGEYCSRMTLVTCLFLPGDKDDETIKATVDELWALEKDPRLTEDDRIFFASFMQKAVFLAEDAEKVARAWKNVSVEIGEASKEDFHNLADKMLEFISKNKDIYSIGINWNSVNSFYELYGETDEDCYDFVKYLNEQTEINS